jgi:hypothetical protein
MGRHPAREKANLLGLTSLRLVETVFVRKLLSKGERGT